MDLLVAVVGLALGSSPCAAALVAVAAADVARLVEGWSFCVQPTHKRLPENQSVRETFASVRNVLAHVLSSNRTQHCHSPSDSLLCCSRSSGQCCSSRPEDGTPW